MSLCRYLIMIEKEVFTQRDYINHLLRARNIGQLGVTASAHIATLNHCARCTEIGAEL